jgi:hypothetical protein
VHVLVPQVQPSPDIPPMLNPFGANSVTVTAVPLVGPARTALETARLYWPVEPSEKLPECVLVMVRTGGPPCGVSNRTREVLTSAK